MNPKKPTLRLSVRAVVELTLHESDLTPAAGAMKRMQEGTAAHKARQSGQMRLREDYRAETALSADYETEQLTLHVAGRADGLMTADDGTPIVEEIKLGAPDSQLVPAHRAQAAMYGHMLCTAEGYERATLRVLYVSPVGEVLREYEEICDRETLRREFEALCAPAAAWETEKMTRRQARDASLSALPFPYTDYRPGQQKFARNVYISVKSRKRLFAQAPTGIGKTMAALYPALRAIGDGLCARAVFLAARTTGRQSAMDALVRLQGSGARVLAVEIAAKDKVCALETRDCRPEVCPRAAGFYDRLPAALAEALGLSVLNREAVAQLAQKHSLCPFELSLELAKLADVVVCDFNYVFDPFVAVDQLLAQQGGACLLVDEAHQLAPRVRDTFSGAVSGDVLREFRRDAGKAIGRTSALYKALTGAIRALEAVAELPEFAGGRLPAPPDALTQAMQVVRDAAAEQLAIHADANVLDVFSLAASYLFTVDHFCERYVALTSGEGKRAAVELTCLNAAPDILERTKRARGTVFFSATLAPFGASQLALGSEEGDACLRLPSPFSPEQLRVRVAPIDIRYAARERTAPQVAEAIAAHLRENPGNALIFFPSYAYLSRIWELILGMDDMPQREMLRETRGMKEEEKNALLGAFAERDDAAVFAVLGGAFSEAIDLPGRLLQSVVVVSTGMPQPDERLRAMQQYYDEQGEQGFFLTMTLPGMVRVIQAAGRLIRTDTDTGSLLLIDSRYRTRQILELLEGTLIGDAMERNS